MFKAESLLWSLSVLTTEFEISLKLKDFFADDFCPVAFFPCGLVLISCQTRHTFTWGFILLSSLWLAVEIETRQVVTLGFKMRWWGWQSKTPRIRAGGFYFSHGCAACSCTLCARILWLRCSCTQLVKTAMLRRLLNYNSSKKTRKQIIKTVYIKNVLFISKLPDKTI